MSGYEYIGGRCDSCGRNLYSCVKHTRDDGSEFLSTLPCRNCLKKARDKAIARVSREMATAAVHMLLAAERRGK